MFRPLIIFKPDMVRGILRTSYTWLFNSYSLVYILKLYLDVFNPLFKFSSDLYFLFLDSVEDDYALIYCRTGIERRAILS